VRRFFKTPQQNRESRSRFADLFFGDFTLPQTVVPEIETIHHAVKRSAINLEDFSAARDMLPSTAAMTRFTYCASISSKRHEFPILALPTILRGPCLQNGQIIEIEKPGVIERTARATMFSNSRHCRAIDSSQAFPAVLARLRESCRAFRLTCRGSSQTAAADRLRSRKGRQQNLENV